MKLIVVMVLAIIVILLQVLVVMCSDLTKKEVNCFLKIYKDRCSAACSVERYRRYCCELSRCQKCYRDIGINQCGENIALDLLDKMRELNIEIRKLNCNNAHSYPSLKCLYHFYSPWFYFTFAFIFADVGLFFVLFRKRRRRRRR